MGGKGGGGRCWLQREEEMVEKREEMVVVEVAGCSMGVRGGLLCFYGLSGQVGY